MGLYKKIIERPEFPLPPEPAGLLEADESPELEELSELEEIPESAKRPLGAVRAVLADLRKGISLYVFFLICGAVDAAGLVCIVTFVHGEVWQAVIFFSRIAFAPILFLRINALKEIDPDKKKMLVFFTIFFFACFSILGIITILFLYRTIVNPETDPSKLYHIDQEEGEEELKEEKQDIQINLEELSNVSPLIDGLTDEEKNVRVAAILAMEEVDSQTTRQNLVSAMKDTSKEVQYYANEAIKKIADMYFSRITAILKELKGMKTPDYQKRKELADLYSLFAEADIEHPAIVESYRAKAIKIYEELLKKFPEHKRDIIYRLIPALYYNRNYDLCIRYCFEVEEGDENFEHARSFKTRAFFALRDIPALIQIRNDIKDLTVHPLEEPLGALSAV